MLFWSATSRQIWLKKSMHLLQQFWSISLYWSEVNSSPNVSDITNLENKRFNCIVEIRRASWQSQLPLSSTDTVFLHFITVFCVDSWNMQVCHFPWTTPFAFQVQPWGLMARLPELPDTASCFSDICQLDSCVCVSKLWCPSTQSLYCQAVTHFYWLETSGAPQFCHNYAMRPQTSSEATARIWTTARAAVNVLLKAIVSTDHF